MTTNELAFGWLVLGEGLSFREAQNWIINANIHLREAWARQQRRAARGFIALVSRDPPRLCLPPSPSDTIPERQKDG